MTSELKKSNYITYLATKKKESDAKQYKTKVTPRRKKDREWRDSLGIRNGRHGTLLFTLLITFSVNAQCIINGVFQCSDSSTCTSDVCTYNPRAGTISCTYPDIDCHDTDICTLDECDGSNPVTPFYICTHTDLGCCCRTHNMTPAQQHRLHARMSRPINQRYLKEHKPKLDKARYLRIHYKDYVNSNL